MPRVFLRLGVVVWTFAALAVSLQAKHPDTVSTVQASDQLHAELVASETLVNGELVDVTFKIEVSNNAPTTVANVRVRFADDEVVDVGDVPGEGKALSAEHRRVIDVSDRPTHNVPIEATLEYSDGDATVGRSIVLVVRVTP